MFENTVIMKSIFLYVLAFVILLSTCNRNQTVSDSEMVPIELQLENDTVELMLVELGWKCGCPRWGILEKVDPINDNFVECARNGNCIEALPEIASLNLLNFRENFDDENPVFIVRGSFFKEDQRHVGGLHNQPYKARTLYYHAYEYLGDYSALKKSKSLPS